MENEFFRFKIHPWILVNITHRISFKNPHLHFPQTMHTFGSDFIIVINWAILNLFVTQTACTFIGTREFLSYRPRGGTSLYKPYGYVSPHWVEFLVLFGLEHVYTLPILVWNRVLFARELQECMNVFIVSIPHE